ncbi:hypothetical protein OG21DRAFT_1486288 [Imleria badia]|nr:hypothetical protein OG21DRAFT_1486288 [Imleria badia]
MDPAKRILASLVSTSQCIHTIAAQYANAKDVSQVRGHSLIRLEMELQAISASCRAILEILDDPSRSRQYIIDDRLIGWLSNAEPRRCLATLNEMQDLLKVDRGVQPFNVPSEFSCPEGEDEVIVAVSTLFHSRKSHFHFLLTGDIWNYEAGAGLKQNISNAASEITRIPRQHPPIAANYMMSEDESLRKREAISLKLNKFLHFLDALGCAAKQKETSSLRQLDTCTWLFSTEEYKSWRDANNSLLLLHGKAGAGKTVLASAAIDDLLETKHEEEILAYFYCDFRTGRSTSAVEVMRSILAQLVAPLCAVLVEPEDLLDDLLKDSNNRAALFYNVKGLSRCLSKIAKLCPRKPLLVVDALDECREVETLLDGLIMAKDDVRIFVTSRPH